MTKKKKKPGLTNFQSSGPRRDGQYMIVFGIIFVHMMTIMFNHFSLFLSIDLKKIYESEGKLMEVYERRIVSVLACTQRTMIIGMLA